MKIGEAGMPVSCWFDGQGMRSGMTPQKNIPAMVSFLRESRNGSLPTPGLGKSFPIAPIASVARAEFGSVPGLSGRPTQKSDVRCAKMPRRSNEKSHLGSFATWVSLCLRLGTLWVCPFDFRGPPPQKKTPFWMASKENQKEPTHVRGSF